jgi:hypothetical protein
MKKVKIRIRIKIRSTYIRIKIIKGFIWKNTAGVVWGGIHSEARENVKEM